MQLIDTHTHLYLPEFDRDREEMINRSVSSGVHKLLMPNIDIRSVNAMLSAADVFQGICFPMIGLHPTSVREDYLIQLEAIEGIAAKNNFIAVGEIGIDLYWDRTFLNQQIEAMSRQVAFAITKGLPVVIHSRESFREVFSVLDEYKGEKLTGVFHAFSGNVKDAEKAIEMGFKLGIGGPITYKNSSLTEIVRITGIGNVVLETDSPYLAPVPYRGKRNESSYLNIVNNKLAEILEMDEEETASVTLENSRRLFKL